VTPALLADSGLAASAQVPAPPTASARPAVAGRLQRLGGAGAGIVSLARGCAAGVLVLVTVAGTFALTAVPFAWIVVAAKLSQAFSLPAVVPLAALLVGIPASMIACSKLLLRVSDLYEHLRGHPPTGRVAPVWRRGLTDTCRPSQRRMLDVVMVVSVCASVLALCIWFVLFAGSTVRL
jgi:hypothetical protein